MQAMCIHEFGGLEQLAPEEIDIPRPGPGEVRVEVDAAGVNYADILMIAGKYQLRPDLPFSPGFEVAGTITACGPDVETWPVGTPVTATPWYGGYAEQVVIPASGVYRLPAFIDATTAVATTVACGTALHALSDRGALVEGETLFVPGATGGVGSAAVQIGSLLGARVIAGVGTPAKVDAARALGADEVVMYGDEQPPLNEHLKALTAGRGVDVVLDPVGGDVFDDCVRAVAPGGRLLVVGFTSGRIPRLPTNLALLKESSVVGVFWGAFREREPERATAQLDTIWDWIRMGDLALPRLEVYPLRSARTALEKVASRELVGKAVLTNAAPEEEAAR